MTRSEVRVGVAAPVGVAAAAIIGVTAGLKYALAAGWIAAAAVYLIWTWMIAGRMNPEQTASHATHDSPKRRPTSISVISHSPSA